MSTNLFRQIPEPDDGEDYDDFIDRCTAEGYSEDACDFSWENSADGGIRVKQKAAPPPGDNPLEYVMSDASVDRLGDVIDAAGWELDNFRKNPVALFGHNSGFPIGKWADVQVRGEQLIGRLELMDPVSDRLREVHHAIAAGVLRAVSVGFHPIEYAPLEESKVGGLRFTKQELVECSVVSVPANPNALQIARALGISREGQALIFGKPAELDRSLRRRGLPGKPAVIANRKTNQMTPNLSDRIQAGEASLNSLRDQLSTHLAEHETLDDAAIAASTELNQKIEAQLRQLELLRQSESLLGSQSTTVEIIPPGRAAAIPVVGAAAPQPRPFAMPRKPEKPGQLLMNALIAHAAMKELRKPREEVLRDYGWADDVGVRTCLEWVQRAATAPATSNTATWAAELVQTQYADLISQLMVKSVYRPLSALGVQYTLGRYGQISIPVEAATPTIAGSFVAEGAPIPVRQGAFSSVLIGLKKMAVITSFTRELLEHSTPNIDTTLRDKISMDTSISVDTVLLDNNPATTVRPAGLRNGVAGLTPTAGGGFAALVADLKALLGVLVAANSVRSPAWIMNDQQALSIALTQSSAGVGVFPFKAEIEAGMLLMYPVIKSTTVPLGTVILVDAADFASLSGDDARFELSDQATLHMEDTAPLPIGTPGTPPTVAAPVRSMFQTDSIALRMIMPMNWIMRRTGLVAWVAGVTW